jgi:hypothetical protein
MHCKDIDHLIPLVAAGLLDKKTRAEVNEHLGQCITCQERYDFDLLLFEVVKVAGTSAPSGKHPPVEQLVAFILASVELDGDRINQIDLHVRDCAMCQEEVEKLQFLPKNHIELSEFVPLPTLDNLVRDFQETHKFHERDRIMRLSPWHPMGELLQGSSRLAAQSADEPRFPTPIILATDDEGLMLKAIRDSNTKDVWIYLNAADPALFQNALIRPFGGTAEYVTDEEGRVNLGSIAWPKLENHTAEVHLPMARFTLSPARDLTSLSDAIVLDSPDGDQIKVIFSDGERNRKIGIEIIKLSRSLAEEELKIAVREGDSTEIVMIRPAAHESVVLEKTPASSKVDIFLFK